MTAWFTIVVPFCLLIQCGVKFIELEYGKTFEMANDGLLLLVFTVLCAYSLVVDFCNFIRR